MNASAKLDKESVCSGCGNTIEPDVCHCGVTRNDHNAWNEGHGFVPMGCTCSYEKDPCPKCGLHPRSNCFFGVWTSTTDGRDFDCTAPDIHGEPCDDCWHVWCDTCKSLFCVPIK